MLFLIYFALNTLSFGIVLEIQIGRMKKTHVFKPSKANIEGIITWNLKWIKILLFSNNILYCDYIESPSTTNSYSCSVDF